MKVLNLFLVMILFWAIPATAAPDSAMQSSLNEFFSHGVAHEKARAELIEVLWWPNTTGRLRWSLPRLRGYPARTILIAEQKTALGVHRWNVPVRLHWWARAIVANRALSTGTILSASLMHPARADIAGLHGPVWRQSRSLIGARLTRNVRDGQLLSSNVISRRPVMRRGAQVSILINMHGIKVRAMGTAMQKGALGSQIRVRNLKSRRILQANIVDAHTVRVYAGGEG